MNNIPTILYIDDSIEELRLVELATQEDVRFKLESVTNSEEFLNRLNTKPYSAVLIDLNLGVALSGTIITSKVRNLYPEMPIVIYTNFHEDKAKQLLDSDDLEKGVTQVWSKSDIHLDNISDKLASLIK